MGVTGLTKYAREKKLFKEIRIQDLVHNLEPGTPAVVVVDGSASARFIYSCDVIHGGQFKQFKQDCINFVERFKEANIELVFFYDGRAPEAKTETWIHRKKGTMRKILGMYSSLRRQQFSGQSKEIKPLGIVPYSKTIFKHLCKCKVFVSVKECDMEIAQYCRQKKAFAVLSGDSDFMVYSGIGYFLHIETLNVKELTVQSYQIIDLSRHLQLRIKQLPLFASLMGNDIVRSDNSTLQHFHQWLQQGNWTTDLPVLIAWFIKKSTVRNRLPSTVFNDREFNHLLETSIQTYQCRATETTCRLRIDAWDDIISVAREKHHCGELPSAVYSILRLQRYQAAEVFEDFNNTDGIPPSAHILLPMRKRLYRLLLQEILQDRDISVEELCICGMNDMLNTVLITDCVPNDLGHPGLQLLWDRSEIKLDDVRWALAAWVISPKMDVAMLKNLPEKFIVPAAALFFLINEATPAIFQEWEIEVFMVTALKVGALSSQQLNQIPVGNNPNVRAVQLATVYLRTTIYIFDLVGACTLPVPEYQCLPDEYFDGKLFHHLYEHACRKKPCDTTSLNEVQNTYFSQMKDFLKKTF